MFLFAGLWVLKCSQMNAAECGIVGKNALAIYRKTLGKWTQIMVRKPVRALEALTKMVDG